MSSPGLPLSFLWSDTRFVGQEDDTVECENMPSESAKKRQAQKKERDRQRQKQASAKKKQKAEQVNGANGEVNGESEGACVGAVGPVTSTANGTEVKSKPVDKKTAARSCTGEYVGLSLTRTYQVIVFSLSLSL